LNHTISYVGTVHARREIKVNAQVPGTVVDLPLGEGALVSQGQLVAEISAPELAASTERVRADQEYWCRRLDTDDRLVAAAALPAEQAEVTRRACRSARAALAEAEAQLAKTRELAPARGRILSWLVEPGQHVLPGQGLVLLGAQGLELHVEVVDEDLRRGIAVGTIAAVRTRDRDVIHTRVSEIAPVTTGAARTFTVKVPLPETEAFGLRVGASTAIDFTLASCTECVAVPAEAVDRAGDDAYLFLVRDGLALLAPVDAGIEDGGLMQVSLVWNGTDRVAVSNLASLADSTPVFPVEVQGVER
jgi:RND family efflux transporter MFP subunit